MENEPRLIVPCCCGPDGDSPEAQFAERMMYGKPTARDYLYVAGELIKIGFEIARNPKKWMEDWSDVWADDIAQATDEYLETRL